MKRLLPLALGALFGTGLVISDLVNPIRILAFLDITGAWDPTLLLVMIGALIPSLLAYRYIRGRVKPMLGPAYCVPNSRSIDRKLIIGALLFGIGWGIAGVCPGPAVVLVGTAQPFALLFFAAMLGGALLHHGLPGRIAPR
ncbi:MAG: YeeE/YedE family protein [Paucimonas sp.]|jgi:uncharacterized membrane protein YedE/YeeE|nr:YeeE/YedE family protein [Paucimonas sp.]